MDCRQFDTLIQPFFKDKLTFKEKRMMLRHADNCQRCQEELRTQYLVVEGLRRLENGSDFNLISDYDQMYKKSIRENDKVNISRLFVHILGAVTLVFTFVILVLGIMGF